MNVERVRVGEILQLERIPVQPDPTVEYVSIGVRSFGKGVFHYEPKLGSQLGSLRFFKVQPNRLVVSNIKGWEGAIAISSTSDAGCLASNRFLTYVPIDDRIDVGWARWYFLSDAGIALIQRASPGSADRNRTLAIERFEALKIPLPRIEEQGRVAARLARVARRVTRIQDLQRHATDLTRALAVSATSRPDLTSRPKAQAGWRPVVLSEILKLNCDVTPVLPQASYDIAGVYSFGRGMFERASLHGSQTSYKVLHRLHAGQLVMSRLKAWEGAMAFVPAELDGWHVSPEFPTFDLDTDEVDPVFMKALIASPRFWASLKGASKGIGARRERVNASRLLDQKVEVPSLWGQRTVATTLTRLASSTALRDSSTGRLDALLPAALNEAFAGLS